MQFEEVTAELENETAFENVEIIADENEQPEEEETEEETEEAIEEEEESEEA